MLSSEHELPVVLQRIIELATELTDARYGALGVLGPDRRIVEFVTTGMDPHVRAGIGDLPIGMGILGALIDEARTLRIPDISQDPRSFGFPPNHPPMRSFLGAPVKGRGMVFGNIYLTEKRDAGEFTEEDERTIEILASQAGVAIENARLHDEAVVRERRLEAMGEVAIATLEGRPVVEVLTLLTMRALDLLHADIASVAVPSPEEPEHLTVLVAEGKGADSLRGSVFPIEGSISGEVVRTGRPISVRDTSVDERRAQPIVASGEAGPALFVALEGRHGPIGSLTVANALGGRAFTDDDLATLVTFAAQASVAVEYERVRSELERMAVLEDRERIAKELHDGVIQALFAVGMSLQAAAALSKDPGLERRIEGAVTEIDGAIRDLRNYIFGLRPGILADRQLDQALRALVAEFEEQSGVTAVADVDPRIAQELSSKAPRRDPGRPGGPVERPPPRERGDRPGLGRIRRVGRRARGRRRRDGVRPGGGREARRTGPREPRRAGGRRSGEPRDRELPPRGHHRSGAHPPPLNPTPLGPPYFDTISAVAMPNIPLGPSTWDRMWQWNAHTPGLVGVDDHVEPLAGRDHQRVGLVRVPAAGTRPARPP